MKDSITMEELKSLLQQQRIQLVDVREHYQYIRGTIKGAINLPFSVLKRMPDKYLLKEETYYFFCENGILAEKLKNALNNQGYHIISVKDGYLDF